MIDRLLRKLFCFNALQFILDCMTISDYFHKTVTSKIFKVSMMVLGIAALIYVILWIIFPIIHVYDFPPFLQAVLSLLGAGLLSYKYLAPRIGA